jgi:hypothetical protein
MLCEPARRVSVTMGRRDMLPSFRVLSRPVSTTPSARARTTSIEDAFAHSQGRRRGTAQWLREDRLGNDFVCTGRRRHMIKFAGPSESAGCGGGWCGAAGGEPLSQRHPKGTGTRRGSSSFQRAGRPGMTGSRTCVHQIRAVRYCLSNPGRLAQRESASFTQKRPLVRSQYRPPGQRADSIDGRALFSCLSV